MDVPELPSWMAAYAPHLLNVAFWIILALCGIIGMLGAFVITGARWWFKGFLARMSAQDAALREIKELVTRELTGAVKLVAENTTRIVRLEEWRKVTEDHAKYGRRKDDTV